MKKISLFLLAFISLTISAKTTNKLPILNPESCTSIMVGKKASTDGSVITSHTCDSYYRTWVNIHPAQEFKKDTTLLIYQNRLHNEFSGDQNGLIIKGEIPQSKHIYSFLDTAYPCMNEKQLGIGETTISGRKELVNAKGMFMIEELEKIVLQRCTTAKGAIQLMGKLIEKYGYGDWGECLTVADKNEVWIFEVFGEGKKKIGGVWAAVRIPDDHVSISANISRISTLNLKDSKNYLASKNVYSVAKNLGFWDGKEPFKFWKAYSGTNYFKEKKSFSVREFYVLNKLAPSLDLKYDSEELPLSVKPEKKLSALDVSKLLRETYEGTEWEAVKNLKVIKKGKEKNDTILSPVGNPWMTRDEIRLYNALKNKVVAGHRNIAVPQCAYSTVIQLRSWLPDEIGGITWLAFDNPGQSPRIPIFCGTKDLPENFKICGQHRYSENAAVWIYRRANKLATVKWGRTKATMQSALAHFDKKAENELPFVEKTYLKIKKEEGAEKANEFLTGYTKDYAGATQIYWKEMSNKFWHMFQMGF